MLEMWNIPDGCRMHRSQAHRRQVTGCCVSADRRQLLTCSLDSQLKLWDTSRGSVLGTNSFPSPLNCATFHPRGHVIAVGSWDGRITVLRLDNWKRSAVRRLYTHLSHTHTQPLTLIVTPPHHSHPLPHTLPFTLPPPLTFTLLPPLTLTFTLPLTLTATLSLTVLLSLFSFLSGSLWRLVGQSSLFLPRGQYSGLGESRWLGHSLGVGNAGSALSL
ncbi:hypothetical protein FKM82_028225 [Ascaphus truei]